MKKRLWYSSLLLWLFGVLIVNQYFFCPQFHFPEPVPFSGKKIYNPYQDVDFSNWIKCNFHAHTHAWFGLTNGTMLPSDVGNTYGELDYGIHCVSNYQCIENNGTQQQGYLPAYEHGYGLLKNHQTVLGSFKVAWKDYILPQTLHNKQYIIARLRKQKDIGIIINHPAVRGAYPPENFKFLAGYDGLEIFPSGAFAAWDSALSAGKPVFCVGNDDAHDVGNPCQVGRFCTWLGVSDIDEDTVLQALKSGKGYVMAVAYRKSETFEEKRNRVKSGLPKVTSVVVRHDTLFVAANKLATFVFVRQGGMRTEWGAADTTASYAIQPEDTYVRTRIFFQDGNEIDLNPVFRYDGNFVATTVPEVDTHKTWLFRIAGIIIMILLSSLSWLLYRNANRS